MNQWLASLSPEVVRKLEEYYLLLVRENAKYNLTAISDRRQVYLRHFFDSAQNLAAPWRLTGTGLDIGCGAGFPGLVIALLAPDLRLTLIDGSHKKINFVKMAIALLGLENVEALAVRAEELAAARREQYDFVVSRAVASSAILLELGAPMLRIGGQLVAMKGKGYQQERPRALAMAARLGMEEDQVFTYNLDGITLGLVNFTKTGVTPSIYPRPYAKIVEGEK